MNEKMENPQWIRITLYLGVFAFASMTLFFAGFAAVLALETNGIAFLLLLPFVLGPAYLTHLGCRLFPFISATVHLERTGFSVENRGRTEFHAWNRVASFQEMDGAQLLIVRDLDDVTIFVVDYWTPGFDSFLEALVDNVGKSLD